MFCGNCGCELEDNARFCPKCGNKVESVRQSKNKNIYIAMVLSFVFTGLGVIYAGNTNKGLMLAVTRILFPILGYFHPIFTLLALIFWIYGFYETYKEVKIANGETPDLMKDYKSLDTNKRNIVIAFIVVVFIIGVFLSVSSFVADSHSSYSSYQSPSSSYSHSGSGGSSYSSHYYGVDDSPSSIARSDPDWYYDHYEYGDDYDIDDYLESEGYD